MASERVRRSLMHHAPDNAGVGSITKLRQAAMAFADVLEEQTPEGREKRIAETKLEETLMWAVKGVVLPKE